MEQVTIPGFPATAAEMYRDYHKYVRFMVGAYKNAFRMLTISHEDLNQELWVTLLSRDTLGSFTAKYLAARETPTYSEAHGMFKGYLKQTIYNWCWNYRRDYIRRNPHLSIGISEERLAATPSLQPPQDVRLDQAQTLLDLRRACEEAEIRQIMGFSEAIVTRRFNTTVGVEYKSRQVQKAVDRWAEIEEAEVVKVRVLG
jgi:hypothetical protein